MYIYKSFPIDTQFPKGIILWARCQLPHIAPACTECKVVSDLIQKRGERQQYHDDSADHSHNASHSVTEYIFVRRFIYRVRFPLLKNVPEECGKKHWPEKKRNTHDHSKNSQENQSLHLSSSHFYNHLSLLLLHHPAAEILQDFPKYRTVIDIPAFFKPGFFIHGLWSMVCIIDIMMKGIRLHIIIPLCSGIKTDSL